MLGDNQPIHKAELCHIFVRCMDAVIIENVRRDCLNSFVFLLLFGTKEKKQEN